MFKRRYLPILIGLAALFAVAGLRVLDPAPVHQVRLWAFDTFQRMAPRAYQPAGVRIIDIDEASLERIGQWPWPRTSLADLVSRLRDMGAAAIALDIVFAEPDRTSPERLLRSWRGHGLDADTRRALKSLPDPDEAFAKAIAKAPVVTGFAPTAEPNGATPKRPAGMAFSGTKPTTSLPNFRGATANIDGIGAAAKGNGSFAIVNDIDSKVRRVPLVQQVNSRIHPSLVAEALRVAQGAGTHIVKTSTGSGEADFGDGAAVTAMRIGRITVPTTGDGTVLLHDTGIVPARSVPAWKILDPDHRRETIPKVRGHIVLIGTSATGLKDVRATPLTTAAPGVSLHAQALEQIILGDHLHRPDWVSALEIAVLLLLGGGLLFILPRLGAAWCGVAGLIALGAAGAGSWFAFERLGWLIDPVYPSLGALAVYLPTSAALFVLSESEKRFVRSAFGRYLSPALVERLTEQPDALNLGGENRELTMMFSDIRGFTPVAETMTPEELTAFMNRFLTPMTRAILDRSGFVDKYMGDAIMAFWNAPLTTPEHPERACRTALDMRRILVNLNREWQAEFDAKGRPFQGVAVGIGVHTGVACVGNMGSEQRFDYSVLGDNVNLASRLEGQSKTYGVDIVISEQTRAACSHDLAFLELDLIRVKGRREPARIHTLLGDETIARDEGFAAFHKDHDAMLAAYRAQDWDTAEAARGRCAETLAASPEWLASGVALEHVYAIYAERIETLRADPPPADWDAVFTARTK